ncbi:MAG: hypothetical protein QM706_14770 [Nitrospira sp.]
MWKSLTAVAALLIMTVPFPARVVAQEEPASERSMAEQLVDAFHRVFGAHPDFVPITRRA